jgi:hypothetical protein
MAARDDERAARVTPAQFRNERPATSAAPRLARLRVARANALRHGQG